MAKKVKTRIRLHIQGAAATPAPPVGSSLGQHRVSIMEFCKQFNAQTANRRGETVPVVITVFVDKTFEFTTKTSPVSELIRKKVNIQKGSSNPGKTVAGKITWSEIEDIAKIKMADLNAVDLEGAKKIIAGSARSMGLEVVS